ncbi:ankyrin-2-like [Penaeus indicus]|uniref:ankyrin-2-like n=1 Tax=Penaeus indicus TaxID=29960 RepID=UPI00300D68BB
MSARRRLFRRLSTQQLISAVRRGDARTTESLLSTEGLSPDTELPQNDPDCPQGSLLTLVFIRGHYHLVPLLLGAGATNSAGRRQFTPMHWAAKKGAMKELLQLIKAFGISDQDECKTTPLHLAAQEGHADIVEALINYGVNIDARDKSGRTPLFMAALNGHLGVAEALIRRGAKVTALTFQNRTALHQAAQSGSLSVTQMLVRAGLPVACQDQNGLTPLDLAMIHGRSEVVDWLRKQNPGKTTELSHARTCMVHYNECGALIMGWAEDDKTDHLLSNLEKDLVGLHFRDHNGRTPLHVAAECDNEEAVRVLLSCGMFPGVLDYEGKMPHDLARSDRLRELLASALNSEDGRVSTYEEKCQLYKELINHISTNNDAKEVTKMLLRGAPIEPVGEVPYHALHLAISLDRTNIVSLLLAAGASLTAPREGTSPLQVVWRSSDAMVLLKVVVTRAYQTQLKFELRLLQNSPEPDEGVGLLRQGINHILNTLTLCKPWQASWKISHAPSTPSLADLMTSAARHNCVLTMTFLQTEGALAFQCDSRGLTPLHVALQAGHLKLATTLVKHLGGSPYVRDLEYMKEVMQPRAMRELEQCLFYQEVRKLQACLEKMKDNRDKIQVEEILKIQSSLYTAYAQGTLPPALGSRGPEALLLASQRGLPQLSFLLLAVGKVPSDAVVNAPTSSTAIHQAAAHGNTNIVALLLNHGANPRLTDRYGHTALHLAAMFGHIVTFQYIASISRHEERCRAGTTPSQICENFKRYLQLHKKDNIPDDSQDDEWETNDPGNAMRKILKSIRFSEVVDEMKDISVDFDSGEAREIRDAVIQECEMIADKIRGQNGLFAGEIRLVGSSADGTRLYAPDEFDISLVLSSFSDFQLRVSELSAAEMPQVGHRLKLNVQTPHDSFQGCKLIDTFHELIEKYLSKNSIYDERLSLVPPGLRRTQVGSAMALAWQGTHYPLLLVNVDFVPVVSAPWHPRIRRPYLTPDDLHLVYLSNTSDGEWRLSFCEAEVAVLSDLEEDERFVYLACKTLLSRMKAEPWMPHHVRRRYTWHTVTQIQPTRLERQSLISYREGLVTLHPVFLRREPSSQFRVQNSKQMRFPSRMLLRATS